MQRERPAEETGMLLKLKNKTKWILPHTKKVQEKFEGIDKGGPLFLLCASGILSSLPHKIHQYLITLKVQVKRRERICPKVILH